MHNCKTIFHRFRNSLFGFVLCTQCRSTISDGNCDLHDGTRASFRFFESRAARRTPNGIFLVTEKEGQNGKAKARDQLDTCKINWFMLRLRDGDKRIRVNKATSIFLNEGISFAVLSPSAQTHTIRKRLNLVINFFSEKTQDIAISFSSHKDEFFILLSSACHVDNPFTSPSET